MSLNKFLISLFLLLGLFVEFAAAQKILQSGPMVGYSTMLEVAIWVQTNQEAEVHIEYWESDQPTQKIATDKIITKKANAFAATLIADQVTPSKKYQYQLYINGKKVDIAHDLSFQTQTLWQWRTDPPNFKFAMGSCHFVNEPAYDRPGEPYGGEFHIFESIRKRQPDFMLWLGDNTYLREADWNSRTGILHRYTHTRSLPEMQALLGATHHYAIWDDHDFGPNNSDRGFWNKELTKEAFKLFWANPNYVNEGVTGTFHWADAQFFLLDNRYFRTPNDRKTGERFILGAAQEEWLIDALKASNANFKFVAVGGQFINSNADYENHAIFPEERERIIRKIREEKIEGVIFLTGDRHHTELSALKENKAFYPIYDLTVSPLTSGTHAAREEPNQNYVENTVVNKRNFGEIEITGTWKNRIAMFRIFDSNGKLLWEREVKANDLKY